MPFFPRQLKRISPHFYVYRNHYELSYRSYPVLRLIVKGGSLPRDEEGELLAHFGFDLSRRMQIEMIAGGVTVYEQRQEG